MSIVLCPFELTRQAPVAVLAALLGTEPHAVRRSVLTWAPRSGIDPDRDDAPLRLLQAWEWSEPLWASRLFSPIRDSATLEEELRQSLATWSREPALRPLAELLRTTRLSEIERDIAQGGRRPGIRILVTALMETWVSRMGAMWFSAGAGLQRGPSRERAPAFRQSMPLPCGADGALLLEIRREFAPELSACRQALVDIAHAAPSDPKKARTLARDVLTPAFHDYAERFATCTPDLVERAGSMSVPLRPTEVLIRAEVVQPGRTLERAARALGGPLGSGPPARPTTDLALRPSLAISTRISPWDVIPAQSRSAVP